MDTTESEQVIVLKTRLEKLAEKLCDVGEKLKVYDPDACEPIWDVEDSLRAIANENPKEQGDGSPLNTLVSDNRRWESIEDRLPEIGRAVWLKDENKIWIGCRDMIDADHWLFGNSYNSFWHDGERWVCDNEIDDDYQPKYWLPLPKPPE